RKTPRHRQINSLQGDQKCHTISHVQASFFLSVVLRRNLPMGPPMGILVVQHVTEEKDFNFEIPLMEQRSYGYFHTPSTKPIIWSGQFGTYSVGQHHLLERETAVSVDLVVAHLKFVDSKEFMNRQKVRNNLEFSYDHDPRHGAHWRREARDDHSLRMFNDLAHSEALLCFSDGVDKFLSEGCEYRDGKYFRADGNQEIGPVKLELYC
ncbi:MAG: hypothetical protein AB7S99_00005, partial [Pseudodonghicola sp.]